MPPRKIDPTKLMVARAIQHHIVTGPNKPPLMPLPPDVESVTASVISQTETSIKVKTYKHGIRYFLVKVSEQM